MSTSRRSTVLSATRWGVYASLCLAAVTGCSKPEQEVALPQVEKGTASISGIVTLEGGPSAAPPMKSEMVSCNPAPGSPKMAHVDRTVRVSKGGGLADVYVFIKNGPKGSGKAETPKVLDQVDCFFEPHALGLQIGQPLRIRNSDPTFHNVHWDPKLNPPINVGFSPSPNSPERVVALQNAEFLAVRCDVHPWMQSTIGVFDNPFFAVTDADGRFTIQGLPAGTYTLTTHHPFYGPGESVQITVPPATSQASASLTQNFSYSPKAPTAP